MLKITQQPLSPDQLRILRQSQSTGLGRFVSRHLWGQAVYEWWTEAVASDLAGGTAEFLQVEVERLAVGEEKGDEGPLLFCDTGTNQVLCLAGQWLYDPHVVPDELEDESDEAWFQSFSLTRAPNSGIVFELRAERRTLIRAERRIPAEKIPFFGPSAIIPGTLDSLEDSLKRYSAQRFSHGAVS